MTIPAHKFVLAISSPVFHAMFYGEKAETKDYVDICDIEYDSLIELFRFMYSDEANLNPDNVMQLMYLAKKYMLPSLAHKCTDYLRENLDSSNVFYVLPDAQKYEEKDLLDRCWKVIEKETDEAVKSVGFLTIERSVLEELVEKDSLTIKEVELFKAVDCWAGKKCEKGLTPKGSAKRRILGERIVQGIRFPLMELKEFADVVLDAEILTHNKMKHMMKYFSSVLNVPVEFSEAKRSGHLKIVSRFRSINNEYWGYSSKYLECIILKVDKNIQLHAVRLCGGDNSKYSVILTVYRYSGVHVAKVTSDCPSKLMRGEVGDYYGEEIVFNPPIALEANIQYVFNAQIAGPPSCYGEGGQACVEHSGVKFSFQIYSATQTKVERGQFSEFVFTLD